jgi:glycolate oxidase
VPSVLEIIDRDSLDAVGEALETDTLAPPGTAAMLLSEVDGFPEDVDASLDRITAACRAAGALDVLRAHDAEERAGLWRVRREISPALLRIAPIKFNHDVVVPRARVADLFALVERLKTRYVLRIPSFGHAGDGNIHVNVMVPAGDPAALARAREAEAELFRGVVALEGAITGEHGIGFSKAPYLNLALSPETIAVMRAIKRAFDPHGILNPGKIFPEDVAASRLPLVGGV